MHPPATPNTPTRALATPVGVLAMTLFLVPAVGVPSELMLQDTLKSAVVAFGVLAAALLFFWQQRQRTAPLQWHGLVWLPLVLMGYALVSMAWSHTYLAGVEAIRWFLLALLLWLGLNTLTRENLPTLLWGIHGGAVVASLWAVLQFWFDFRLFPQGPNPASTFVNRNFFAEYVVCTLPFSVYLLANMRTSRWLPLLASTVALNVVALMMTGTRSALLAMWVLVPVCVLILVRYRQQFALMEWNKSDRVLVGVVLVAGVWGMGSIPSGNPKVIADQIGSTALQRSFIRTASIAKPTEYTEGSFSIRSVMWKATARMVMANPWTGVGAGAWEVQIPLYEGIGTLMETDYYAHNEYLQLLGEYGVVVGGGFLAFLWAYLLKATHKTLVLQGQEKTETSIRAISLASLLALLVVSSAGFPWRLASTGGLLVICLAVLASSDARLGIAESFYASAMRWHKGYSSIALVALVGCTTLAIYITQQAATTERKIVRAIELGMKTAVLGDYESSQMAADKSELLQTARQAISINPHYRKLTPIIAVQLAAKGDWTNAVWIWESLVVSRPYVAAFWYNLTKGYLHLKQYSSASAALSKLRALQPDAPGSRALEIILLSRTGHQEQAIQLLTDHFLNQTYDFDMVQAGYRIGQDSKNWTLAIWSLELRNRSWPEHAADAFFKMGHIYADTDLRNEAKAIAAFRAGFKAVPRNQQHDYLQQVPERYRSRLKDNSP